MEKLSIETVFVFRKLSKKPFIKCPVKDVKTLIFCPNMKKRMKKTVQENIEILSMYKGTIKEKRGLCDILETVLMSKKENVYTE